ncbi:MAG: TonB-dependent receptor [Gemmatimonadota bacterium]|jgi:outer membrane receptor for ferrienterochelin and colicins
MTRTTALLVCLLCLAALCPARPAAAQQARGVITGVVKDTTTGGGIRYATVEARGAGGTAAAETNADGRYRLQVAPGTYTIAVSAVGYVARRVADVRVTSGAVRTLDVVLEPSTFQLNPLVVTASRRKEKALAAPAHVQTVRSGDIQAQPAVSPVDYLRGEAGLDVASAGLVTSDVVARGFNNIFSGSLLTLVDHRIAAVPSLRLNAFYLIPPSSPDIDRMELVLGPASALYGPNSADGVLQIVTKSPFDSPGTEVSLAAGARAASCPERTTAGACTRKRTTDLPAPADGRGILQGTFRTAGVLSRHWAYRVSGQVLTGGDWQHFDSFEDSTRSLILAGVSPAQRAAVADTLNVARRSFAVQRWSGDARVDYRPGDDAELIFSGGLSDLGNGVQLTPLGAAQARRWGYRYYQTRFRSGRLFAQVYLNTTDAGHSYLLRTGEPVVDHSRMLVGQVQDGLDLGPRQSFTYGLDALWTNPRTGGTIDGRNESHDDILELGGYVQSETHITPLVDLVAALRLDHHSRLPGSVLSPRLGVVLRPTPTQSFRLTYNRAFSTPTPSDLFLDIKAADLADGRFQIRALGVPSDGLTFRRDCSEGLDDYCMRSPFVTPTDFVPANAGFASQDLAVWDSVVALVRGPLLAATGFDIAAAGIPAPGPGDVGTVFRTFDQATLTFRDVSPAALRPVDPLRPTITSTLEAGYKGILNQRLLLAVDLYYTRKTDFIGPLIVETPAVFFDATSLAAYLRNYISDPTMALLVANAIAGVPGSGLTGVPLGVVNWDNPLVNGPNMYLTFRNFGKVDLWGSDVTVDALLTDRISVQLDYSHVSDNFFPKQKIGGLSDVPLNAPRDKGAATVRYRDELRGLQAQARVRYVGAFPMNSGAFIGDIAAYTLLDLDAAARLPFRNAELSLSVQNVLNHLHREFVGAPELGTVALLRLRYAF